LDLETADYDRASLITSGASTNTLMIRLVNSNKAHGFDMYQAQSGILKRLLHQLVATPVQTNTEGASNEHGERVAQPQRCPYKQQAVSHKPPL
jgi:hypothetical protein